MVEAYVRRFIPVGEAELDKAMLRMVERLRGITTPTLVAEPVDLRFYSHELREYLRYKKLAIQLDNPLTRMRLMNFGTMLTQLLLKIIN